MSKLYLPETFIGSDQTELLELHAHDQLLDMVQTVALGEQAVDPIVELELALAA